MHGGAQQQHFAHGHVFCTQQEATGTWRQAGVEIKIETVSPKAKDRKNIIKGSQKQIEKTRQKMRLRNKTRKITRPSFQNICAKKGAKVSNVFMLKMENEKLSSKTKNQKGPQKAAISNVFQCSDKIELTKMTMFARNMFN